MPVQHLNERPTLPAAVSKGEDVMPKGQPSPPYNLMVKNDFQFSEAIAQLTVPERTTASRRVTSPSSGNASNLLVARKTSFQSDRIMPNDDLLLAKARAAGTRNYPNKVSNFQCLGHTFSHRHKTLPNSCILYSNFILYSKFLTLNLPFCYSFQIAENLVSSILQ